MRFSLFSVCICFLATLGLTLRNRVLPLAPVFRVFRDTNWIIKTERILVDESTIFHDVISSIVHVPQKAIIEVKLTGKRCDALVLRGRLTGEQLAMLSWFKSDSGTLVGTYDQLPPGVYFIEIVALYCSTFNRSMPVHIVKNTCLEDPRRHRVTALNSSIHVVDISWPAPANKIGSWSRKRELEEILPIYTRTQPNGCNPPECDISRFSKLSQVELMYNFTYSKETMKRLGAVVSTNSLRSLIFCFVGASHSRTIVEMLSSHFGEGPWFQHVDARYPNNLNQAAEFVRLQNCTHAVIGIGQWPAGWPGDAPMGFQDYEQSMHGGLVNFTNIVNTSTKVYVRNVHENPLGNIISSCPPRDWRNPEVVRIYNELLLEVCTRLKYHFIDTTDILGPMWDTAPDWCHYKNEVGRVEAIYILQFILQSS